LRLLLLDFVAQLIDLELRLLILPHVLLLRLKRAVGVDDLPLGPTHRRQPFDLSERG
jgi:hypothetical protein